MWEVTLHILNCELKNIENTIETFEHKNSRQETAITAMNDLNPIPENIKITIKRFTKDIVTRNLLIDDWKNWKNTIENEISEIKRN